jgi:hypothetical protein
MNKYLIIENLGHEGLDFKSIESEKNKEELEREFNNLFKETKLFGEFNFYGRKVWKTTPKNNLEINTLEEFWESYR